MGFSKYPKIEQFRNVVSSVVRTFSYRLNEETEEWEYDPSLKLPSLTFSGTTKVHGTNAGVYISKDGDISPQKRNSKISLQKDNFGFAAWLHQEEVRDCFKRFKQSLSDTFPEIKGKDIVIYGEWCGGNIQKGVAITGLPKMFIIFDVKVLQEDGTNTWLDLKNIYLTEESCNIYDVKVFGEFEITVDFQNPDLSVPELQKHTGEVENVCPVGEYFGVKENTTGEGVVWSTTLDDSTVLRFKVKGEKHQSSRVKTLAPVDVEKIKSVKSFVEYSVTPSRLEQASKEVLEILNGEPVFDRKNLGKFIKWVSTDILEEESDTLVKNGLCMKDVGRDIGTACREWFFEKELL